MRHLSREKVNKINRVGRISHIHTERAIGKSEPNIGAVGGVLAVPFSAGSSGEQNGISDVRDVMGMIVGELTIH